MIMERLSVEPDSRKTSTAIRKAIECIENDKSVLFITDTQDTVGIKQRVQEMGADTNKFTVEYVNCSEIEGRIKTAKQEAVILDINTCVDVPFIKSSQENH